MSNRDEICHYLNYKPQVAARIADECSISTAQVLSWEKVPAGFAPAVAALLRIDVKLVRPDVYADADEMLWPPLPHYISECERWDEMQRDTAYGEDK